MHIITLFFIKLFGTYQKIKLYHPLHYVNEQIKKTMVNKPK